MDRLIRRGEIFYIDRYEGQFGSEQHSGRPGVIVSNDANNETSPTVEVVYMTTRPKKQIPTHVKIYSTGRESTVLCEQVTTVSVDRLGTYIGRCTNEEMEKIGDAIVISLSLKDCCKAAVISSFEKAMARQPVLSLLPPDQETIPTLRAERDAYKDLCDRLLDRLMGKISGGGC